MNKKEHDKTLTFIILRREGSLGRAFLSFMIPEQGNVIERLLINNHFSPDVQLGNGLFCSGKLLRNLICFRKRSGNLCE